MSSSQLCDLVNYVLGLPLILGGRWIVRRAIDPVIVATWSLNSQGQAENWCETQLWRAGVLEEKSGLRRYRPPSDLERWIDVTSRARGTWTRIERAA